MALKKIKKHDVDISPEVFKALFSEATDAMVLTRLKNNTIYLVNPQAEFLIGAGLEALEGESIGVLTPKNQTENFRSKLFQAELLENDGLYEDVLIQRKDFQLRVVSLSVKKIKAGRDSFRACILKDVSEKKSMERDLITKHTELRDAYAALEKANLELKSMQETLVQSGKLSALGELAAGIAHELNQPLTGISGFAQEAQALMSRWPQSKEHEMLADHLGEIQKGSVKMQKIIEHLRNFTRKSTEDFQWVNVNSIVEESLTMLKRQFSVRDIEVEEVFEAKLPEVFCNPFQLEQVFINLATNARDAIEERRKKDQGPLKGKIRISTEVMTSIAAASGQRNAVDMIQIRFEDNGFGIQDQHKTKIFNPFFTTKEVGKGMGLGLSITYGILSKINASIFVESEAGKGTVFTLRIPVDYRKH